MAASTLTSRETRDLQVFVDAALERNPGAGRAAAVREGTATWREWQKGAGGATAAAASARRAAPRLTAAQQTIVSEAVAAAIAQRCAARKAAKRERRQAREAAAQAALAGQFTEAVAGRSLRESSREDLAAVAAVALGATAGMSPFHRASPRGAITEEAAAAGRVLEALADAPGYRQALTGASPDGLRRQLGARLRLVGDADGLASPFWKGPDVA